MYPLTQGECADPRADFDIVFPRAGVLRDTVAGSMQRYGQHTQQQTPGVPASQGLGDIQRHIQATETRANERGPQDPPSQDL